MRDARLRLLRRGGELEREAVRRDVDDAGVHKLGNLHDLEALLGVAVHLDERQLAADKRLGLEHLDLDDGNHLVELLLHLLDDVLVAVDNDGHAGDLGMLRHADGEAVNVEAAPREEAGHLRQDAWLVFHKNGKGGFHRRSLLPQILGTSGSTVQTRIKGPSVSSIFTASSFACSFVPARAAGMP